MESNDEGESGSGHKEKCGWNGLKLGRMEAVRPGRRRESETVAKEDDRGGLGAEGPDAQKDSGMKIRQWTGETVEHGSRQEPTARIAVPEGGLLRHRSNPQAMPAGYA